MKKSHLSRFLLLLPALMMSGIILSAQSDYNRDDPRWTDEDTTNDPNTCFEAGRNCGIEEEWRRGWCEARARAGLSPCGAPQTPGQRQSSDSGGSSSSRSGGSSSSNGGGSSSSSGSVTSPRQTQASSPPPASVRRGRYRLGYDCPYGKVCVGHWPSGEIEVYDLDNHCCWDRRQAIDTFNVYD